MMSTPSPIPKAWCAAAGDGSSNPYSTTRRSKERARAWKQVPAEHIQAVRAGYMATHPVVYTDSWEPT